MDDFEKWWMTVPLADDPGSWEWHDTARAAYEAGQAERQEAVDMVMVKLVACERRLSAAQKVIEAAEGYGDRVDAIQATAAATEHHHNNPEWLAVRRALADYHTVTKDDQKPSPRDIQSSVDTSHEPGGEK